MEGDELTLEAARQELIRLLVSDDCLLTERAENEGKAILRRDGLPATERGVVAYVLKLLRANYPMHKIKRGQPAGSLPDGYVMNNADGRGLYIELILEDDRAWVISFHTSKHYRGG
jgi:hypothetical protein